MDDTRVNEEVTFVLDRVSRMEQNSEEYRVEPAKNEVEANGATTAALVFASSIGSNKTELKLNLMFQSDNESNDEDYTRSPVLLDLDENSKQQQRKIANREVNSPNSASMVDQHLQDQVFAPEEATRAQAVRSRWQETSFDVRSQQNPEGVLVIRVPEPEMIGSHSHLEMLHETNIKSVQRESSQTEKGTTIPKCASPGDHIHGGLN
ncbi:hypothetical protein DMN91_012854 [Ooceraea biroi]|uniref:Uncharacterized protein n=1 Tax=Ooceraea biroi TaxID=2015173 RepID=A0A3L8D384_OOCBI|nr:hypothetical protein DMN91_012854 [Ooceraea biroi]